MVTTTSRRELLRSTIGLLLFFETAKSIQLLAVDIPKSIQLGTRAALSCRWQLGPADVLYSVKWYKDGKEFFRHVPGDIEPCRRFPLPGVDVEDSDPNGSLLVLAPATLPTGGRYRCEVSGERPRFPTVSDHADMGVIALPEHGPVISGFDPKYRIGDKARVNCTSGHSQPATQLSWYMNGEPLRSDAYIPRYRVENALIVTSVMLHFEVTEMHFKNGVLKVKCLATITPMYWKSNEETAVLVKNEVYHDKIKTISVRDHRTRPDQVHASHANPTTKNVFVNSASKANPTTKNFVNSCISLSIFMVIFAR